MLVARRRSAFLAVAAPAIVFGLATLALVLPSGLDARQATVGGFVLVIAAGFVGAGLWVVAREPATRLGLLCTAIGCALFFACWVFADAPAVYTLGLLGGLIWTPIVGHFVLAFPSGPLQRRAERRLVAIGYAIALVLQPLPWLFWPGGWDAVCTDCPRNLALIAPHPELARALLAVYVSAAAACGIAILLYVARVRWWRVDPLQRRAFTPVVVVLGALLVLVVVAAVAVAVGAPEVGQGLDFGYFTALVALPFAMLASSLRGRAARAEAVTRLTERLAAVIEPEQLRGALVDALGDPSLEIAYWDEHRDAFVDGSGRALARNGRVWTEIRHEGGCSARSCTTPPRSTGRSTPRAPRSRWRSSASGSPPRCAPPCASCEPRAPGSCGPATTRGAGSNVTCTTAPSSGSSRCCSTCNWGAGATIARRPGTRSSSSWRTPWTTCAAWRGGSCRRRSPTKGCAPRSRTSPDAHRST